MAIMSVKDAALFIALPGVLGAVAFPTAMDSDNDDVLKGALGIVAFSVASIYLADMPWAENIRDMIPIFN